MTRTCTSNYAAAAISDPDLLTVVEAWPALPDEVKAGILAMVTAASKAE